MKADFIQVSTIEGDKVISRNTIALIEKYSVNSSKITLNIKKDDGNFISIITTEGIESITNMLNRI